MKDGVTTCAETVRLEIVVIGNDHQPLADAVVELEKEGEVCRTRTDENGFAAFDGVAKGPLTVRLAMVDASLWQLVAWREISPTGEGGEPAPFSPPVADANDAGGTYICLDGDTADGVAAAHGVPVELLKTSDGATVPRDCPAAEGDTIILPARALRRDSVEGGNRYVIFRRDVPFTIIVRLRDHEHFLRPDRPYLLKIAMRDGTEAPVREGATNDRGMVVERIPYGAATGELLVDSGDGAETFPLRFTRLHPASENAGVQERLEKLGFPCGGERGEIGEATRAALQWFQYTIGLPVTGELNEPTRTALAAFQGG